MSRFDLAGNPLPDADVPAPSPGPAHPVQTGQPWGTVSPPPPPAYSPTPMDTLGPSSEDVPPEIARLKWNWGAFFLPPFWCASNGYRPLGYLYDLLAVFLVLSPFLYGPVYGRLIFWGLAFVMFDIGMYLGTKGNGIAWRNRVFNGPEDFFSVQRGWMIAGLAVALPLDLLLFGWMASVTQQEMHRRQAQQGQTVPAPRAVTPAPTTPAYQPAYLPPPSDPVVIMRGTTPGGNGQGDANSPSYTQSPSPTVLSPPAAAGDAHSAPAPNPQYVPTPTAGGASGGASAGSSGGPSSTVAPPTMAPAVSGQSQAPPTVAAPPAGQPSAAPPIGIAPGQ